MDIFSITTSEGFLAMLVRFLVCVTVNWIIVDRLYFARCKRRDFYFTFTLSSIAVFFLVFFMIFALEDLKTKTSIGIGIGLFGIFSIMRYRTDAMPVREMTYLFVIIALSVINAIAASATLVELLLINMIVVFAIWLCERRLKIRPAKLVQYDRIDLIAPDRKEELTYLMDTPGFSSMMLKDISYKELRFYYPEFDAYEGTCRFQGCVHVSEPDCSVKSAVKQKMIVKERYDSYCYLYEELKQKKTY